jgi:DNA polymerase I-like protein with 3'-5' exonuclease and polymerase domains
MAREELIRYLRAQADAIIAAYSSSPERQRKTVDQYAEGWVGEHAEQFRATWQGQKTAQVAA